MCVLLSGCVLSQKPEIVRAGESLLKEHEQMHTLGQSN